MTLVGPRPDAPGGTVALRALGASLLGALRLSGLSAAGGPTRCASAARLVVVEQAAAGLQLVV
ncbi:hypothetical protein [Streptomyces xantholiticus]|uniref:hypothetical protein n=1 Tax=Streptomyces xantholiticus TaxID=68285 RepID=UPI00167AFF44|nr:hypothetical protein [Streptomyces xantholiticus]